MSDADSTTAADLDKLACEAVDIKPLHAPWHGPPEGEMSVPFERDADPVYPPVSEEPAACAMLEEAAIAVANRIEIVITDSYAQAQVGRSRVWSRVFRNEAKRPKERAVALAVVAWRDANP